jgi:hypothetical protein
MEDVGLFLLEEFAKHFDLLERAEALSVNGEGDMAAPLCLELPDEATAVGDDQRFVTLFDQIFADLKRAAFDATRVEFGEYLDDFHAGGGLAAAFFLTTDYTDGHRCFFNG